jgi:hypothetical protein
LFNALNAFDVESAHAWTPASYPKTSRSTEFAVTSTGLLAGALAAVLLGAELATAELAGAEGAALVGTAGVDVVGAAELGVELPVVRELDEQAATPSTTPATVANALMRHPSDFIATSGSDMTTDMEQRSMSGRR